MTQERQNAVLFADRFDELRASMPNAHLVYSRSGLHQAALGEFRKELVTAETSKTQEFSSNVALRTLYTTKG
jgi:hypothetical protein